MWDAFPDYQWCDMVLPFTREYQDLLLRIELRDRMNVRDHADFVCCSHLYDRTFDISLGRLLRHPAVSTVCFVCEVCEPRYRLLLASMSKEPSDG